MTVLGLGHWLRWSVFTFKVAIRPAPAPAPGGPRSHPWSGHAAPHWAVAGHGAITCLGPQHLATVDTRDSRGSCPGIRECFVDIEVFFCHGAVNVGKSWEFWRFRSQIVCGDAQCLRLYSPGTGTVQWCCTATAALATVRPLYFCFGGNLAPDHRDRAEGHQH